MDKDTKNIKQPHNIDRVARIEDILATHLERRTDTMLENHTQTVIVFVILGVLSWVGYSILQTEKSINIANVSMEVMKNDIKYMKEAFDKASNSHVDITEFRVSTGQLQRDLAEIKARLRLLEQNKSGLPINTIRIP